MAKSESEYTWKDFNVGAIIADPGSARQYESGTWRSQRPTYDFKRCIKCGMCAMFCPEGCIGPNEEGYYEADMFYCKGCGICANECWTRVITMVEQKEIEGEEGK
jgi:pyruvate ferredoxin oxidoreductase delta subunit